MACEYVEGTWLDTATFILAALLFFSPILLGFRLKRKEIQRGRQGYWWRHFLPSFSTVLVIYMVAIYISVFLSSDICLVANLAVEGPRIGHVVFMFSFIGIGLAFHAVGFALAGSFLRDPATCTETSKGVTQT
jgi:hypothetical protein